MRAALVYDPSAIRGNDLSSAEGIYRPINVELISSEKLPSRPADDFDVIGILGRSVHDNLELLLEDFSCLKIGFYPDEFRGVYPKDCLKHLTAAVVCLGSTTLIESLRKTVFHFYESLTLPSLLNIDLADVESIAHGMGVSFNISGGTSEDIINHLPLQCFFARSALLHFSCEKNVTLEEVYRISKTISTRKSIGPFVSENPSPDQIKMYKRIRLKMGLRISQEWERSESSSRISLTGILFGIKPPEQLRTF